MINFNLIVPMINFNLMVPMVPIINLEFFLITNWRINKQETNNLTFFGEFELY